MGMNHREAEEILEALWTCSERNEHTLEAVRKRSHARVDEALLASLEEADLIAYHGQMVMLTREGKKRGASVVRRHRLAERLLTDVLKMPVHEAEANACEFEHSLAPEVTESICTLLGHPRECPHGAPIPEGECCAEARHIVENVVVSLDKLEAGERARVAYMRTRSHPRLHKLLSFGIGPGAALTVHQRFPSYVVSCEHTELALEKDVIEDIFVWRDNGKRPGAAP